MANKDDYKMCCCNTETWWPDARHTQF